MAKRQRHKVRAKTDEDLATTMAALFATAAERVLVRDYRWTPEAAADFAARLPGEATALANDLLAERGRSV